MEQTVLPDKSYPRTWQGGKRTHPYKWMGSPNHPYYRVYITDTSIPRGERIRLFSWNTKNKGSYPTEIDAYAAAQQYIVDVYNKYDAWKNSYRYISPNTIEVKLTQNRNMLIDAADLHYVEDHFWWTHKDKKNFCAITKCGSPAKLVRFHQLITGFKVTKHLNRNMLDNRRENLKDVFLKRK